MARPSVIAIDGTASSGKSTIGKLLAKRLGYRYLETGSMYRAPNGQERFFEAQMRYLYFDTGVMYRAVTWVALQRGIGLSDEAAVTALANEVEIDVTRPTPTVGDGRQYTVYADDQDVTWRIRRPEVDANVSMVSAYLGVRKALTEQQRRIGRRGHVVMVGRDVGTVVMPDADLKIYLDASAEERAHRRNQERLERGESADYEEVLAAIRRRDKIDSEREVAPMRPAEDAFVIDTTNLTVGEVLAKVMELVKKEVE
jgi:cytidylate kinase